MVRDEGQVQANSGKKRDEIMSQTVRIRPGVRGYTEGRNENFFIVSALAKKNGPVNSESR